MGNNPTGKGGFQKGQSGNPAGRPKKGATLSDLLYGRLCDNIQDHDRSRKDKPAKDVLSRIIIELATNGRAKLADGSLMVLDASEYLRLLEFVFNRIDGKPQQAVDVTTDGAPVKAYIGWTPDDWDEQGEDDG